MEEVKVKIGIDDKGFATGLQRDIRQMEQLSATAKKGGMSIDDMGRHVKQLGRDIDAAADKGVAGFSRLEKAAIGFFTIQKAKEFIGKVYEVRSEIEKLETSFRILVGNRAEADALFASIRKFAVETPMLLKDLAGAAQTMMGFGIAAGDVMEDLKALGNVAMGDSQKFQSLALAFSQMSATGKLMGQDFLQMVNAGFNPLDQMAKTTGKSVAELNDEMSKGAISADMVRQAFIDATSEGGKFNGMLEAQSKTLAGAYSNLQGAIEDMFNELGEKSEGIMTGAIEVATLLAKNYETVGKVLLQLIATYGSYKVAVMAVTVTEAVLNGTYTLKIRLLRAAVVAQQLLNKTMLANPYVAVATALMAVVSALIIFRNRTDEAAEAQKRLKESFDTTQAKIVTEQKSIDALFEKLRKAQKGTTEYKEAKDAILSQYGDYLKGLGAEIEQLINVEGAYKAVTRAAREAALARGREAALGEANEQYGKNYASSMGKLREAIIDKAGKQEATTALNQIQKELRETGTISSQTEAKVRNLLRGSFSYGESAAWFTTLRNNEQALQDAVEQADELFRTEGKKVEDETVKAKTLGEAYAEAQKKYEEAYKKVEDMKNARAYYTEQQWKDAQEALKNAKKAFEDIGGDPDGKQQRKADAAANRKSEAEKKQAEFLTLMGKQATERERAIKDLEFSTRQAEIDTMKDGSEKTIRQIQLDFDKRREEIERGYEDLKQKKVEAAKKLWEANPDNKGKIFDDSTVDTDYSAAEMQNRQKLLDAAFADYVKLLNREEQANRDAVNTYLKQYGDYAQKKQAIYDKANADICELEEQLSDATTAEARAAIQARIDTVKAGTKEQIEELDQQYGKTKQFMIDLFGDASQKSVAEIEKIIRKYEELEKFLQGNSSVSRKSLIDLGFTEKEIDQALEKLSQGKITVKDFTDSLKSMREELAERSPWQKYKKDIGDALKMLKEADGDSGIIGTAIQNIGSACSEYLPQVEKFATGLYNLFGIDDSGAKGAISAMQGLSVVAQGVGQIISGEFMDGLVNAVDGAAQAFNGLAEMINDISTSRDMEAEYDNIELKAIRKAVDKIVEKFDNDSMAQAMADYEQAMKLYEDELKKAQETLRGAFSKSSSDLRGRYNHHSINYYMNDFGGQAEFDAINQLLGTNVQGWGDLWFLSPDQLAEIETRLPRIFAIIQKGIAEMSSNASASSHDEEAQAALDAYMELAGQKEKIEDAFNLKMTGTSFDSVKSDFKNMLADMTSDTEAFGEKIQDILLNSVANQLMSDRYSAELEEWYKSFKNAYKNDGKLDEDEVRELRESYQRTAEEALKDRDALMSIIGDTSEAKKYFDNLRDMWLTTLTDMKADAKDWEKEILRIMVEDLISTTVLNEGFTAWLVDWKKRYTELMKAEANHEINQQERDRRMQELLDEQIDKREQLAGQAKEIMDSLGYTEMLEEADDAFDDLRDQFVDALMDMDTDAEEWGRKIAQTIARQFIEQELLNEAFGGMLDEWKADVAELMEHGFGQGSREDTEAIERLKGKVQELVNKYKELAPLAQEFMEAIGLGKEADSATSPFKDLRTSFVNTLMDMQTDAESFRKQLQKTLTQHLMEGLVDNFTVGDLGFNEWLKKWNDEYMQTFNNLDNPDREEDLDWYINELVKVYGQLLGQSDELRERLKELAEDTTFKDMTSGWVSSLMDFNATAEDWAEDIGRTMAQKIIEQMIVPTLVQPLLDTLQAAFNTALKAQEESSTDWSAVINADGVQAALKTIQDAYPELKETVQRILATLNITPEVEAAKEAFGDLTGTIVSGLTDAEMTAEEFSKNIARTLTEQLMKQIVESQFAETMKGIQDDWAKALESGDTSAIEAIRQRIVQLYKDAGRATDELRGIFEEVKEGDTTFKDMADSWLSALFDMDSTASDFGRKIGRTLVEKLVKELVVTKHLQKYLDDIQTAFDNAIGKEGATIESVLAAVIPAIDAAVAETEKWKPVVEEIAKRFEELDKSTPLDNIRSNFLSQLMDMKSDTKDFAQSINETLTEAFIDRFVLGDEFDKRLEEWKNEYASIMGGNYSEEKRAELLNQLKRAITVARDGYAEEAKIIHDLMGTASYADQTATMNMSDKATQEQMDQYLGVQMGIYMVTEQILTTLRGGTTIDIPAVTLSSFSMATETTAKQILSAIQSMKAVTNPDSSTILEMRNMMATGNEYLLDIKRSNREILTQFGAVLNSINGKLAKL